METEVLDAMISDRGSLLEVSEDFAGLCRVSELLITCFFEQRISNLGKIIGRSDIKVSLLGSHSMLRKLIESFASNL
jgi:hypothetical protein